MEELCKTQRWTAKVLSCTYFDTETISMRCTLWSTG